MIKVKLEALDGKPITERTGKSTVNAETQSYPVEGGYHYFFYVNEDCESPGVAIATDGIETLGKEAKFYDHTKRPFKITYLE